MVAACQAGHAAKSLSRCTRNVTVLSVPAVHNQLVRTMPASIREVQRVATLLKHQHSDKQCKTAVIECSAACVKRVNCVTVVNLSSFYIRTITIVTRRILNFADSPFIVYKLYNPVYI